MPYDSLIERVAWCIKRLRERRKTWPELSTKLGASDWTLSKYAKQIGTHVKDDVIINLTKEYGFSESWISQKKGEPFPGARDKYPEVCDPIQSSEGRPVSQHLMLDKKGLFGRTKVLNTEEGPVSVTLFEPEPAQDENISTLGKAVDFLQNILNSNDQTVIRAILANLEAFNRTIQQHTRQSRRIAELENRVSELEKLVKGRDMEGAGRAAATGTDNEET